jgi:hypothetical protein
VVFAGICRNLKSFQRSAFSFQQSAMGHFFSSGAGLGFAGIKKVQTPANGRKFHPAGPANERQTAASAGKPGTGRRGEVQR